MVNSGFARRDVDNVLLTKTIFYLRKSYSTPNLMSGEQIIDKVAEIPLKAQVTVQSLESRYVTEGKLNNGDLVGLFRFEYTHDAYGSIITPKLVPQQGDRIKFLDMYFEIKSCTPATGEDDGIIAWDFTAGR